MRLPRLGVRCRTLAVTVLLFPAIAFAAGYAGMHYETGPVALLDLETPAGEGPFRVVVAVHGGGWWAGTRADAAAFCREMVKIGLACASIDYRTAPATRFPGQIEDVEAAIRFLTTNAAKFRLVTSGVVLAGESAGGQIVAWLGAQHPAGVPIRAVIAFSTPTDLAALGEPVRALGVVPPEIHDLLGVSGWGERDVAEMRLASPVFAIRADGPPFLLVHGRADRLVPAVQSENFCGAIRNSGGHCETILIPGARHGLWSEDQFDKWRNAWLPAVTEWLDKRQDTKRQSR